MFLVYAVSVIWLVVVFSVIGFACDFDWLYLGGLFLCRICLLCLFVNFVLLVIRAIPLGVNYVKFACFVCGLLFDIMTV